MRFSAQGYARLNDGLAPHIAVLEGGYSIEDALPYVNVGIILAMAGLPYDHVREPDFDPAAIKQAAEISRYIEKLVGQIRRQWDNRFAMKEKITGSAKYIKRHKDIYYDTDNIQEQQTEIIRICNDCGGLVTIDSKADTGRRIFAVIIPAASCPACRQEGEETFGKTEKGPYHHVYLQDRDRNIYVSK
jgi:hypothetical protein